MRLLQGSWCEILTLTLVFRSLESGAAQDLNSFLPNHENKTKSIQQQDFTSTSKNNSMQVRLGVNPNTCYRRIIIQYTDKIL